MSLDSYLADDPKDREQTCEVCEAQAGEVMLADQWVCRRCEDSLREQYQWYACKWSNADLTIITAVQAASDSEAEVKSHDLIVYDYGITLKGYEFEYEQLARG